MKRSSPAFKKKNLEEKGGCLTGGLILPPQIPEHRLVVPMDILGERFLSGSQTIPLSRAAEVVSACTI